ncbi:Putative uncharacterized protein [Moritella viscosa]|uniref:DUF3500 domain-containing protein n=2 Tax=Moritella viscosa TaxID=80854 RepID=A0A1K9YLH8_9GAMM|nr:Putative uncharacterized protein [Moritella viscosa]
MVPSEETVRARIALRMSSAADLFISSLRPNQLSTAAWSFPSDTERTLWFYTPSNHGGLTLGEMNVRQQALAFKLLATGLSEAGYATVTAIIGLENILDRIEGHGLSDKHGCFRDPNRYYLRIFGDPNGMNWGWRFGGHHISINNTIVNGQLSSGTPSFLGADPATVPLLGAHMLRPLGSLQDTAFDLLTSFTDQQQSHVVISSIPPIDIVGGNRSSIDVGHHPIEPRRLADVWRQQFHGPQRDHFERVQDLLERQIGLTHQHRKAVSFSEKPKGLAAADMNKHQRDILTELINLYVGRLPDEIAELELRKVTGDKFDGLHFAWAGETNRGEPNYYRIQGEGLVIEFDNTQRNANHIHSVWRDPKGDFSTDLLAQHYAKTHHH